MLAGPRYTRPSNGERVSSPACVQCRKMILGLSGPTRSWLPTAMMRSHALPALNAIADTVGGALIGKLIPKLAPGGTLGSVLGKPKAAEGKDIRVEAVLSHPDASLLRKLAEAVRSRALVIPVAREFSLRDAGEAQTLSERGSINGKIVLVP